MDWKNLSIKSWPNQCLNEFQPSSWKTNLKCWVGLEGISFISLMGWMHVLVIPFYCCLPICERTPLWLMFTLKQNDNILSCCVLKTTTSYMDCVWFVKLWFKKAYYAINRRQDRHVLKYWLCCKSWPILIHSRRSFLFIYLFIYFENQDKDILLA